jgi:MoaA/NifB/PqqE/SkfB family radical SAM enzyme
VNTKLLDVGIEKISVSLESADEATFRDIRGGKLSKVIRGIEALLDERRRRGLDRPIVGFSITVLRRTRDHLPAIIALYRKLGLDGGVTLQPLERKADYANGYDAAMAKETLDDDEVERIWIQFLADREIQKIKRERSPVNGFYDELMVGWRPGKRFCPWLEQGMFVNREGHATPCCMVKDTAKHGLGRIGVDPPEKILSNRKQLRDELARGVVPEACQGCELARYSVIGKGELLSLGVRGLWHRLFSPGFSTSSSSG